jgi:hypothetical protein
LCENSKSREKCKEKRRNNTGFPFKKTEGRPLKTFPINAGQVGNDRAKGFSHGFLSLGIRGVGIDFAG